MQTTTERAQTPTRPGLPELPGRAVLADVQRLIAVAVVSSLGYNFLLIATKGGSIGATAHDGARSVMLTLHPSFFVFIAIAAVFFGSVARVRREAVDGVHAHRILRRAAWAIVIIAAGSLVIAYAWFFSTPLAGWPHPGVWFAPFPFGTVNVELGG